jgi:alpha-beta hydrolase superfamily lysophospholipase
MPVFKWIALACGGIVALGAAVLAAMIVFGTAAPPRPTASVSDPMRRVDFSDLPPLIAFAARDGATLHYRAYAPGNPRVVVVIHGSAGGSSTPHALARGLAAAGFAVYAPELRGHGIDGRLGDLDYVGQLDDDLADLVQAIRREHPQTPIALLGHSSGGGFALRIAEGPESGLFARYVLLAPALRYDAPTHRTGYGGWAVAFVPRLIALGLLDRLGITWFQHLPVVAFGVDPHAKVRLAPTYSFVMARNFAVPRDYLARLAAVRAPITLLVGADDELFYADRFAPLLHPLRGDMPIIVLPGLGHMDLVTRPEATGPIVAALS